MAVRWKAALPVIALLALPALGGNALAAQPPVGLGTAATFAVLSGSAVTNTGPSIINGDLGVSPGTAVTGFPPGTVNGTTHAADAVAAQAQADQLTAYNDAAGRTPVVAESGDLGGQSLTAGVYNSASSLGLTGTLTLDAQGDPNAVFIFQIGSTLTTASASQINLINGAQACNVYWQVGSSATLGTASVFVGNILAQTSISMDNGVTVAGRAFAQTGAVTLINDAITPSACTTTTVPVTSPPIATTPAPTVPAAPAIGTPAAAVPVAAPATTATGVASPVTTAGGTSNAAATLAAAIEAAGTKAAGTKAATTNNAGGTTTTPAKTKPTKTTPVKTTPVKIKPTKTKPTKPTVTAKPRNGTATLAASRRLSAGQCVSGSFRVGVTGHNIRRVVFSLGAHRVANREQSPFGAVISAKVGMGTVSARVTFTDATRALTRHLRFRECAVAAAKVPTTKIPKPVPVKLKVTTPSKQPISTSGFTG
jgi:hypothetical protein